MQQETMMTNLSLILYTHNGTRLIKKKNRAFETNNFNERGI